ncbi:uncharacterized protein N7479_009588 [Penicillium vulpinum]|uniref:Uncharacterized protein n=1 Tax=Penicillium vulpinum TaxID=29845 RepID=A0A1V6RZ21_9EURO|nr:uncharacterized protein N7479_009588 [Penicillium vulpinum]KAJ5951175.1 hypothetical protein N7479_009588 [Penicillium vulpinum]OQE06759.1 hypothetical protein PENVUL_c016G05632 [Penicillium vulpinum]
MCYPAVNSTPVGPSSGDSSKDSQAREQQVSLSPTVKTTEEGIEVSMGGAVLAQIAGGVGGVYHSPLTAELFVASPAAHAAVEYALKTRLAQIAVDVRSMKEDLAVLQADRKQLAALQIVAGRPPAPCWTGAMTSPDTRP